MELIAKADIKIQRPPAEVFEAIVQPHNLANYFVSSSSGPIVPGASLKWRWDDAKAEGMVQVEDVSENHHIRFRWGTNGQETTVNITLERLEDDSTHVSVTEEGWPKDDRGIVAYAGNTRGWTNFLDCLKAFIEYGINLRKGAF